MSISLLDATRSTMMADIVAAIGSGSRLKVYAGTMPAKTAGPLSSGGTLLATPVPSAVFGDVATGVLTARAIATDADAAAGGTPTFFRVIDGTVDDGTHTVLQGPCSVSQAGTDGIHLVFTSTIAQHGSVSVSSFVVTEGNP